MGGMGSKLAFRMPTRLPGKFVVERPLFPELTTIIEEKNNIVHVSYINSSTVLVTTIIDAQWEGMGDVGSARYEPALLPPCPTIKVLSYSN